MKIIVFFILFITLTTSNAQVIAPDFTLTDIEGVNRNLYSELDLGKPIILDFFSNTCGSCISNIPTLENYWQINGNNGDSMWVWGIEINGMNDSALIAFHNLYPSTFPNFSTYNDDSVISLYNITYSPQYWVVCPSRFMKFVSIANIDQAIKGCKASNSVNEFSIFDKINWFHFENNNLTLLVSQSSLPANFIVCNLLGNIIFESALNQANQVFDLSFLSSGLYVISVTTNNKIILNGKILKY
jgi:thiol-disulfide isomerase/thioredoxin